ncbi:hypothetical protein B5M09_007190 [Aphanomyces astaci]|uniref:EF-hand domain-containing protein n=1 Tax=Aphanomyces astaci TaxID=112090 RepID=A0A3R7WJB5_APHAT|nr:hypothetical protein B5M09_007190 [Aphanomyces astaci]
MEVNHAWTDPSLMKSQKMGVSRQTLEDEDTTANEAAAEQKGNSVGNCHFPSVAMDLMMRLKGGQAFKAISDEFHAREQMLGQDGLPLADFVEIMLKGLPKAKSGADAYDTISGLIDLFNDIDINGDGTLELSEFTSYCVDAGMVATRVKVAPLKYQYIKNKEFVDRTTEGSGIEKIKWCPVLKRALVVETKANSVKIYTSDFKQFHQVFATSVNLPSAQVADLDDFSRQTAFTTDADLLVQDAEFITQCKLLVIATSNLTLAFYDVDHYSCAMETQTTVSQTMLRWCGGASVLATTGNNHVVSLWRVAADKVCLVKTLAAHHDVVLDVLPIREYDVILTCDIKRHIYMWDIQDFRSRGHLVGHTHGVRQMVFSSVNDMLLTAGFDFDAFGWDVSSKQVVMTLSGHRAPLVGIQLARFHTERAVTADVDGHFKVWNIHRLNGSSAQLLETISNVTRFCPRSFVTLSPRRDIVAGSSVLHMFESIKIQKHDEIPLRAFYHHGSNLFIGVTETCVNLWDGTTGALLEEFTGRIAAIQYDSINKLIVVSTFPSTRDRDDDEYGTGGIYVFDDSTIGECDLLRSLTNVPVETSSFSYNASLVATVASDAAVHLWDFETLQLRCVCTHPTSLGLHVVAFWDPYPVLVAADNAGNVLFFPTASSQSSRPDGGVLHCLANAHVAATQGEASASSMPAVMNVAKNAMTLYCLLLGRLCEHPNLILSTSFDATIFLWDWKGTNLGSLTNFEHNIVVAQPPWKFAKENQKRERERRDVVEELMKKMDLSPDERKLQDIQRRKSRRPVAGHAINPVLQDLMDDNTRLQHAPPPPHKSRKRMDPAAAHANGRCVPAVYIGMPINLHWKCRQLSLVQVGPLIAHRAMARSASPATDDSPNSEDTIDMDTKVELKSGVQSLHARLEMHQNHENLVQTSTRMYVNYMGIQHDKSHKSSRVRCGKLRDVDVHPSPFLREKLGAADVVTMNHSVFTQRPNTAPALKATSHCLPPCMSKHRHPPGASARDAGKVPKSTKSMSALLHLDDDPPAAAGVSPSASTGKLKKINDIILCATTCAESEDGGDKTGMVFLCNQQQELRQRMAATQIKHDQLVAPHATRGTKREANHLRTTQQLVEKQKRASRYLAQKKRHASAKIGSVLRHTSMMMMPTSHEAATVVNLQPRFGMYSIKEVMVIIRLFWSLDVDCSGTVSESELMGCQQYFEKLGITDMSTMFRSLDSDGTGEVSLGDLLKICFLYASATDIKDMLTLEKLGRAPAMLATDAPLTPEQIADMHAIFEVFDRDHSGTVSLDEVLDAVQCKQDNSYDPPALSMDEIRKIYQAKDRHGKKELNFSDFMALLQGVYYSNNRNK